VVSSRAVLDLDLHFNDNQQINMSLCDIDALSLNYFPAEEIY